MSVVALRRPLTRVGGRVWHIKRLGFRVALFVGDSDPDGDTVASILKAAHDNPSVPPTGYEEHRGAAVWQTPHLYKTLE